MTETDNSRPTFLIQQSYLHIQNGIINGSLQPGQSISPIQISEQLKIEKNLIEKTFDKLTRSGLITADNDGNFNVTKITESTIRDIYQTLLHIDTVAITQSIQNGDAAWEAKINKRLKEFDKALNQPGDVLIDVIAQCSQNFHNAIVANCNSPTLLEIRSHLYQKFDVFIKLFAKHDPKKTQLRQKQKEHYMIAQAAINRDAKTACSLNYYHIIGALKDTVDGFKKINSQKMKTQDLV